MSVRLGGIYALEGVMNTSEQYHQPVLEALCAFVRDETQRAVGSTSSTAAAEVKDLGVLDDLPLPATEIQAALRVIKRRKSGLPGYIDLSAAHVPRAELEGADLSGADLRAADLNRASLFHANLEGAWLSVDIAGNRGLTWLVGADLRGANLSGASLFIADLSDADLSDANLSGGNLGGGNLGGAKLSGNLIGVNLSGAKGLTQTQLDEACGTDVKGLDQLYPPLKIKPCPPDQPVAGSAK